MKEQEAQVSQWCFGLKCKMVWNEATQAWEYLVEHECAVLLKPPQGFLTKEEKVESLREDVREGLRRNAKITTLMLLLLVAAVIMLMMHYYLMCSFLLIVALIIHVMDSSFPATRQYMKQYEESRERQKRILTNAYRVEFQILAAEDAEELEAGLYLDDPRITNYCRMGYFIKAELSYVVII